MRILVADPIAPTAIARLRACGYEVREAIGLKGRGLIDALQGCSGLIVRGATKVTAEVLRGSPELRVVVRAGTGLDNIDQNAALERRVKVMNTPAANAISVAELVWGMILAHRRQIVPAAEAMRAGGWEKSRHQGVEVMGKTLGLVGFGRVAREVARRGRGFQVRLLAYDPLVTPWPSEFPDVEDCPLESLLERSDIVSLHVPLLPETRNLIGAPELARMKSGALLVNCARGGVVDEAALERAIASGRLAGACLDVFAEEPPKNLSLLALPGVLATPHLGASTEEAQERAGEEAAKLMIEALREFAPA